MGQIKFTQFYTRLVENYLRVVIQYKWKNNFIPQEWHNFTTFWLDQLSEEDKKFIYFVFDKQYENIYEGLGCYPGKEPYQAKREWLYRLERDFAIAGGLIVEEIPNDRGTESEKE